MRKIILISVILAIFGHAPARAQTIFNLNVFDQLQGEWKPEFREQRMKLVADFVKQKKPDILVFQEAKGLNPGEKNDQSIDGKFFQKSYPNQKYIHEMLGKDGASYGYLMASKKKPKEWKEDGFAFEGGVARRVQAAVWGQGESCLGVLSLHLSYQKSEVRQKEAQWILDWLKNHESECKSWIVVGDFNADKEDAEMKILFEGGLVSLFKEIKPTIGAFNPIRRIYGENIPSRTIDWALGWNISANAEVVLDKPIKEAWVSDHAAVLINVNKKQK